MKCVFSVSVVLLFYSLASVTHAAPTEAEVNDENMAVRYDGAQLWRIDIENDKVRDLISHLESEHVNDIELWNLDEKSADLFLKQSAIERVRHIFATNKIHSTVLVENLQEKIDAEKAINKIQKLRRAGGGHNVTWTAYHRTNEIYAYLESLERTYPNLCKVLTIGKSYENRSLKVLRITNGKQNPAIWVDGGIHAREWISPASVTYFINELVTNWTSQPDHIRNINWYIQPLVNPDGYEYSHRVDRYWRKNRSLPPGSSICKGVDLNRNFGFKWGGLGTSANPCAQTYRGPHAFSEPESEAQRQFFAQTKERFRAFLTFHSYGQYILYPWGYAVNEFTSDQEQLDQLGRTAAQKIVDLDGQRYRVGASGTILYPAAGASDDWAKSIGIKYSYTVELRDTGRHGFALPASLIIPTAKEAVLYINATAAAVQDLII